MQQSFLRSSFILVAILACGVAVPVLASSLGLLAPTSPDDLTNPLGVRDRPGTPNEVLVKPMSPTSVGIQFHNTAKECVFFEFSTKINGELVNPADNPATPFAGNAPDTLLPGVSAGCTSAKYILRPLGNLQPETVYCFQVWSRDRHDIRSDKPSAWACGTTAPYPPLAPLDVKAYMISVAAASHPRVSWNTPDQTNHRGITRFTIERQTTPGAGRPWVSEGAVTGPAGSQSAGTRLAYTFTASTINPKVTQIYRVCAENDGGHTCAQPVALEIRTPEISKSVSINDPIASVAAVSNQSGFSSLTPQAKTNVLAGMGRTSQAGSRFGIPQPSQSQQSPDTAGVKARLSPSITAAAKKTIPAAMSGSAELKNPKVSPEPAAVNLSALVRQSDLPRNLAQLDDNAIIIVGGTQVRAGDVKQEVLKLDDTVMLHVGGKATRASQLKGTLHRQVHPGSWGDVPGNKAALNPQPLPPQGTAPTPSNVRFKAPASALQR